MFLSRAFKIFLIVIVAFTFASVGNALAAANTVPATNAGDGAGAISAYAITNVQYNLNAINPQNIDSVEFDIAPAMSATGKVRVQLVIIGSWFNCSLTDPAHPTCTTVGVTALAANQLTVVAAQ